MHGFFDPLTIHSVNYTEMPAALVEHLYLAVPAVPRI